MTQKWSNSRTGNVSIYTRSTVKEFNKIDTEIKEKEGVKHDLEAKMDHDTINRNYTIGKKNQIWWKFIIVFSSTRFKYNVLLERSRFKTDTQLH